MSNQLPEQYKDLAPYLDWALETERQRVSKRLAGPMEALTDFYNAMLPHMDGILTYLSNFDVDAERSEELNNIFLMSLSMMDVSMSVERFDEPDESYVFDKDRFEVKERNHVIVGG